MIFTIVYVIILIINTKKAIAIPIFILTLKGECMNELKDITNLVLSNIEEKLPSKTIFNLWFGNFELVSLDDEKAVFKAPTKLRRDIILNKYYNILSSSLLGCEIVVCFL